ncbi:hypothetical protein BgiBS90_013258, partial [Biomphalaria glabrata]
TARSCKTNSNVINCTVQTFGQKQFEERTALKLSHNTTTIASLNSEMDTFI